MSIFQDPARSNSFRPQPLGNVLKGFVSGLRTGAAIHPVWQDSEAKPIIFTPMAKKKAVKLYHHARRFERQTRHPGKQDGALGRNGLKILETFVFDIMNFRTGELLPSIKTIAAKAGISRSSVRRGLDRLKAAGVIMWQRRKDSVLAFGQILWFQKSNAYHICQPDRWFGYRPQPEPPAPEPTAWGATPPLPAGLDRAVEMWKRREATMPSLLELLSEDPLDGLQMALASLGRCVKS